MNKQTLAITQCFPCGSWLSIEKITDMLSDRKHKIQILGYGSPQTRRKDQKYYLIPYLPYNRFGYITCYSPLLGIIWNLPLFVASLILLVSLRPDTTIYNGLGTGLLLSPVVKFLGGKNIIMYHSTIRDVGTTTKKIVRYLMSYVDMIVVNSKGSELDIADTVGSDKIVVNHHFAAHEYFKYGKKKGNLHESLNVLYVGRIDKDKHCFPLMDYIAKKKGDKKFQFTFAGAGSEMKKIKDLALTYPNVKFLGYIEDKSSLSKLYRDADLVWAFADTTYLALPAVEALACDTPIIVPKYAAIAGRKELIIKDLVPKQIGWLVDPFKSKEIESLMDRIQQNKEYMEKRCFEYAVKHYSSQNLLETVKIVERIIDKKI